MSEFMGTYRTARRVMWLGGFLGACTLGFLSAGRAPTPLAPAIAEAAGASSLTSCKVTAAELSSSVTTSGTAPKVAGVSGKLAIDGSTALSPLFAAAAQQFDAVNGTQTTVTPNGSGNGLKDVKAGAVQIGLSDVFAQEKSPTPDVYKELVDHQVGAVVLSLVVSNDLKGKVDNLTLAQIKQIFTGQVSNWKELGGPNEGITVINRPSASGVRATFKKYVLGGATESAGSTLTEDTTGAVAGAIKTTPGAIGYVSVGFVTGQYKADVSPICIEGAKPIAADVNSGKYPFWNIEHAYTNGPATGLAKALLKYVSSPEIQKKDLLRLSYLPVSAIAPAAIAAHTPAGAPQPEVLKD